MKSKEHIHNLKEFDFSLNMTPQERAEEFQKLIDQLAENRFKSYWVESIQNIGARTRIKDQYTNEKKEVISFISNDYLGMSRNKETINAGIEALLKYGTGACAAPIIGGYLDIHRELEKNIAEFVGQEDALIFSSGFGTNVGVLNALVSKNDIALIDSYVHSSVLDGLCNTNVKNIGHNDLKYLEMTLKNAQYKYTTKLVIIDGVYSQDGDLAPIPEIYELCKKYDALLMIDDAHGIGVMGKNGRGTAEHFDMLGKADIITGTFSKAFGCVGGFAAASKKITQYLRYYARTTVFSASPTPQVTASISKALEIMKSDSSYHSKLWSNVHYLRDRLLAENFDIGRTESPVFPIMIRDDWKTKKVSSLLLDEGIYAIGIVYPAVTTKETRIRASVLSTHETSDLDHLVNSLCKIDKIQQIRKS